jgi:uncharacterized damage-inducible protein DinB
MLAKRKDGMKKSKISERDLMVRLVTYDKRVFEAFERGIQRRGWAEATADRGIGHRSFKDTLVHILNVHEAWLIGAAQGNWSFYNDPSRKRQNVRSWNDLRSYRKRVWSGIDRLMAELTDEQLRRRVKVPWMAGRYTLEDAFFQSSFEQAHHIGEIIGAYWQMDRTPPQMVWIPTLLRTRASAR